MVSLSEGKEEEDGETESEKEAYKLGEQVAAVAEEERKAEEDAADEVVTDAQREAYAAGHAVGEEVFPDLPEDNEAEPDNTGAF